MNNLLHAAPIIFNYSLNANLKSCASLGNFGLFLLNGSFANSDAVGGGLLQNAPHGIVQWIQVQFGEDPTSTNKVLQNSCIFLVM